VNKPGSARNARAPDVSPPAMGDAPADPTAPPSDQD